MILTPYATRAGSVYDTQEILSEIKKVEAMNRKDLYPSFAEDYPNSRILFVTQKTPDVPGFVHPLVNVSPNKNRTAGAAISMGEVYVDVRPYTTLKSDGTWSFRSDNDMQSLIRRALLSLCWADGEVTDFLALGELPLKMYLNWVGNTISRHLAIDPLTQFRVSALAGIWYLSQHYEPDQLADEKYQVKIADKVARAMRGSLEEVYALMKDQDAMVSLDSFCNALQTRTGSVRLENVSIAYLFNVVGGSWYGNNSREITAMALDHVPTWISILYQAINDRSYRKSGLSQMISTLSRTQEHKDFNRSVVLLLKE